MREITYNIKHIWTPIKNSSGVNNLKIKQFLKTAASGAVIGVAMIIPGVSGGTLAVLLDIYDKLINSISNIFKDFKNSISFLLPLLLGAAVAMIAAYFPIKYALEYAPLPTVLLFVGLMIGSLPQLLKQAHVHGFDKLNIISFIIPLAVVIGICFIPSMGEVDLSASMNASGYVLLFVMGLLASCALVVPGISGSMLLMIFGYYYPILAAVSGLTSAFGHYLLVLGIFAIGIIIGFFTIAQLMKLLLNKFPRGTYWAIVGFVIGSIPAVLITFDYDGSPLGTLHIVFGVILCILGIIASFALNEYFNKKTSK